MADQVSLFYDLLRAKARDANTGVADAKGLAKDLQFICAELLRDREVRFPNFFSRLSFLIRELRLTPVERYHLHALRIAGKPNAQESVDEATFNQYLSACILLVARATSTPPPDELQPEPLKAPEQEYALGVSQGDLRATVLEVGKDAIRLAGESDDGVQEYQLFRDEHPEFTDTLASLEPGDTLSLVDVTDSSKAEDAVRVRLIVFEPDYLLDVSSLAECFQEIARLRIANPALYFISAFKERVNSEPLFLGNLVNTFLDKLIYDTDDDRSFAKLFRESFHESPLSYAELFPADSLLKDFMNHRAKPQYDNLRRVIDGELQRLNPPVLLNEGTLEPSFLSPVLGLQGRLDLLHLKQDHATIVELKSGKVPWPPEDADAINESHAAQARLYRMLLHKVLGIPNRDIHTYLLYSSAAQGGTNLRYVVRVAALEQRLIAVRNAIVIAERLLATSEDPAAALALFRQWNFASCDFDGNARVPGWFADKFNQFQDRLSHMSPTDRDYFFAFSAFVAREQWLGRMGDGTYRKGHSGLWNKGDHSEQDGRARLGPLTITENRISEKEPTMRLHLGELDAAQFDFRKGDICVLYPLTGEQRTAVDGQVIKCYLASEPDVENVLTLGFRYPQRYTGLFEEHAHWAIEHDHLDSGFRAMQRSLFSFATTENPKKKLLYLDVAPREAEEQEVKEVVSAAEVPLTYSRKEINDLLHRALHAPDYFLLVGPPGTGKTSLFLRHLVRQASENGETLLLLAYTNRAVDEICEAVTEGLGEDAPYLRIGSSTSCGERYKHKLLHRLAAGSASRKELSALIADHPIVIGTVSSLLSRTDIFRLKQFNRIVVDEASQVLEPMLCNLLLRADRFVLIGDDKQLPAVVQQHEVAAPETEALAQIGLTHLSNSLFERLLMAARERNWNHCWGTLTHQGRLHPVLMDFVNRQWYGGILRPAERPHQKEQDRLPEKLSADLRSRWVFLRSGEPTGTRAKVHPEEALLVAETVRRLLAALEESEDPAQAIGVITPYRSQIAAIKGALRNLGVPNADRITVDTVERYQGSQRDHIIYSTVVSDPLQLKFLASNTLKNPIDGVVIDRKLNVAVTRARKQFILVGHEQTLMKSDQYAALMAHITEHGKVYAANDFLQFLPEREGA